MGSPKAVNRPVRGPGIRNRSYTGPEVETLVRLSIDGVSDPAIARALGRTPASVREKLDRIGVPGLRCNGQCHGLRLCLPNTAYAALEAEAAARTVAPGRLAETLLTIVARDGLFHALLDA